MTKNMPKLPVYLDYQATTPVDKRVLDVMLPFLTDKFGNPHSVEHSYGWEAEAAVDVARKQVADIIGTREDEIIFTSGATESNNLALKGGAFARYPDKNHVITVETEHECVLGSASALEKMGFDVTYLGVDRDGIIDIDRLEDAITERTSMVSVMAINNEIGVIQDLKTIGNICRNKGVIFHTDAAQAVGKIPLDVDDMNVDLMSISGHKIYGPKGIGALYVRSGTPIVPLFDGGGQEQGLRSGTLSPALCAGIGAACSFAMSDFKSDTQHISKLYDLFLTKVRKSLNSVSLNGSETSRFPGNINLTVKGVKADLLIADMKNIAISSGSACSSAKHKPSYVLKALGLTKQEIETSVRIGFGRMTTDEEMEYAADYFVSQVQNLSQ